MRERRSSVILAAFLLLSLVELIASWGPISIQPLASIFASIYSVDKLGNLVNRTLTMIQRYCNGAVPEANDRALQAEAERTVTTYHERMNRLEFVGALEALWDLVVRSNQYVEESAPWKLAKDPAKTRQLDGVLYNLAESVRLISVLVSPFMPTTSDAIRTQLGVSDRPGLFAEETDWGRLAPGTKIGQVAPLFPKRT